MSSSETFAVSGTQYVAHTYAAKQADAKIKNVILHISGRPGGSPTIQMAVATRLETTHDADVSRRTGVTSPIKTGGENDEKGYTGEIMVD